PRAVERERGNLPGRLPPVNPALRAAMSRRAGTLAARWVARGVFLWAAVAAAASPSPCSGACSKSVVQDAQPRPAPLRPAVRLLALAEVRGQIGPCGCTTDPLGDLARTAQMISDARAAGPVLVVDAGSLLYSKEGVSGPHEAQEELKAELLARTYREE